MRVKVAPEIALSLPAPKSAGPNGELARLWQEARQAREAEQKIAPRRQPAVAVEQTPRRVYFNHD
jgi:hypothetical protein